MRIKLSNDKKLFMLILLFFCYSAGYSQLLLQIDYKRETLSYTDTLGRVYPGTEASFRPRMIFNDSFTLVYYYSDSYKRKIKGNTIGHKIMHHGIFSNHIAKEKLNEVDFGGKEKYLIEDSFRYRPWQFLNEQRIILNKKCYPALFVNEKSDSILVWYTKELIFQNGALFYDGIPGVVMEVFDQTRDQHFTATAIIDRRMQLVTPREGKRVSASEWIAIRDARRRY